MVKHYYSGPLQSASNYGGRNSGRPFEAKIIPFWQNGADSGGKKCFRCPSKNMSGGRRPCAPPPPPPHGMVLHLSSFPAHNMPKKNMDFNVFRMPDPERVKLIVIKLCK